LENLLPHDRIAAHDPAANNEAGLRERFQNEFPAKIGEMSDACIECGDLHWREERTKNNLHKERAAYSSCCKKGSIKLPVNYEDIDYPAFLKPLFVGTDEGDFTLISNLHYISFLTD
jgi:hypothetical protein